MEKVTDSWLKKNGWVETTDNSVYETNIEKKVTKRTIYTLYGKKNSFARYDHFYEVTTNKYGKVNTSNWYAFYCSGNGFHIENRISFRKFSVEQIESAIKVIGLK